MMNGSDGPAPMEGTSPPATPEPTPVQASPGLSGSAQIPLGDALQTNAGTAAAPLGGQLTGTISGHPAAGAVMALGAPLPEDDRVDQKSFLKGLALGFGILILFPILGGLGEALVEPGGDDYVERSVSAEDLEDGHHEIVLSDFDWESVGWVNVERQEFDDSSRNSYFGTESSYESPSGYSAHGVILHRYHHDNGSVNQTVVGGWSGGNRTLWLDIEDPALRVDLYVNIESYQEPPVVFSLLGPLLCFGGPALAVGLIVRTAKTNKSMAMGMGAGFLALPVILVIACFGAIIFGGGIY